MTFVGYTNAHVMPKRNHLRVDRKAAKRVKKLSSDKAEARDEGPRLIPFEDSKNSIFPTSIQNAIHLADIALGNKKPKPKP